MTHWVKKTFLRASAAPDSLLVRRAKQGDVGAFEQLYKRYIDPIYRYMYFHLNQNKPEAEDATSKVFFQAMKSLSSFDMKEEQSFRGWLYTIARNTITDVYRKHPLSPLPLDLVDTKNNPEDTYHSTVESKQLIQYALTHLSAEQKEVITLKSIEGYSYQEIAVLMHKKEEAVRALHSRGLKEMKKVLTEYETKHKID